MLSLAAGATIVLLAAAWLLRSRPEGARATGLFAYSEGVVAVDAGSVVISGDDSNGLYIGAGAANIAIDRMHVLGVVSLIFWSMLLVVAIQYVTILMRADNKGQGGTLALLALLMRQVNSAKRGSLIVILGVFATALFYGDSMITPAISVLSAVEGITVVQAGLEPLVVPIAVVLLIMLFMIQKSGTSKVGALFAPVMIVYFVTLAVLGIIQIVQNPVILYAINPYYALQFFLVDKWIAFLALGSVVLAVTGSEALYADMGHFGKGPLRLSWFGFVMPALLINYFGQGAMIDALDGAAAQQAMENPFFLLAPDMLRLAAGSLGHPAIERHEMFIHEFGIDVTARVDHLRQRGDAICDAVMRILDPTDLDLPPHLRFVRSLVCGRFGADRMDYLLRDSHCLGVQYGCFDLPRILHTLTPVETAEGVRLGIERGGVLAAEGLQWARFSMFTQNPRAVSLPYNLGTG